MQTRLSALSNSRHTASSIVLARSNGLQGMDSCFVYQYCVASRLVNWNANAKSPRLPCPMSECPTKRTELGHNSLTVDFARTCARPYHLRLISLRTLCADSTAPCIQPFQQLVCSPA